MFRVALILAVAACAACTNAELQRAQCALDAVKFLPEDPEQATVADARDVVQRLNSCRSAADAGAR